MTENRIRIGRVVGTQGRCGELRVIPDAKDWGRFKTLKRVWVQNGHEETCYDVRNTRKQRGAIILWLVGVDDLGQAKEMVGTTLSLPMDEAVALDEDENFVHDLVGLEVQTTGGRTVGRLKAVVEGSAHDFYEVETPEGEILLPAVKAIVVQVDLEARVLYVEELPGLLVPDKRV